MTGRPRAKRSLGNFYGWHCHRPGCDERRGREDDGNSGMQELLGSPLVRWEITCGNNAVCIDHFFGRWLYGWVVRKTSRLRVGPHRCRGGIDGGGASHTDGTTDSGLEWAPPGAAARVTRLKRLTRLTPLKRVTRPHVQKGKCTLTRLRQQHNSSQDPISRSVGAGDRRPRPMVSLLVDAARRQPKLASHPLCILLNVIAGLRPVDSMCSEHHSRFQVARN